ncbi:hypothetical protein KKD52_14490 [Myxococcota bacterium]|nr:hypothetical protein [Myxococcota bacterium]MBU1412602.1 hypothetical protein [Myxococcota bacterium]MBU1511561.1 hypothetical protein [Myxococcota bacterium]
MPGITRFLVIALVLSAGCTPKKTTPAGGPGEPPAANLQWSKLGEILDHYDEAYKITSMFNLDVFVDGAVVESSTGRHEYMRGEEKWFYMKGTELQKTVECYVDKAVVRVPLSLQPKPKRGRKPKAEGPDADIVSVYQSKYPCAVQALVRYNSMLQGNKLSHDGKVYVVNSFDADARTISKISMHKDNRILVYSFSNIKFEDAPAEEPAKTEPADVPAEPAPADAGNPAAPPAVTK